MFDHNYLLIIKNVDIYPLHEIPTKYLNYN